MKLRGYWYGTDRSVEIEAENGRVTQIYPATEVPSGTYLAPGFFDLQVNGYGGLDYSSTELTTAHVEKLAARLLAAGTTRHVPTIITNSQERICANLRTIASAVSENEAAGEAIPAVHVEGPYISEEDGPRGAHDAKHVRDPNVTELAEWMEASAGLLKMVTIAPERPGALDFIREAVSAGVVVALGHTAATPDVVRRAVDAGARVSTHLGNGSHAMVPRLRNYLWEQLAADQLTAGIIADGFHLPHSVMKVFARAKGLDRLVLVSDVGPMGGLKTGLYHWGDIEVEVHEDGHLGLAGTEFLAGAGHLLDRAVAQIATATGLPIQQILPLCTINPTRLLGFEKASRTLSNLPSVGDDANLVQFSYEEGAAAIEVEAVVRGHHVWSQSGDKEKYHSE